MNRKVAVMGLLAQQAARIKSDFPKLSIKFLSKDQHVGTLAASVAAYDYVVAMTKFIDHAMWRVIPKEKLIPCNGGLTQLRQQLDLLTVATEALQPHTAPVAATPAVEEEEMTTTHDYSPLKTMEVGQSMRLKRDPKVLLTNFEKRVSAMRSYYRTHYKVTTDQQVQDDGHIIVTVLKRGDKPKPIRIEEALEAPTPPKHVPNDALSFWEAVFLQHMQGSPGNTVDSHANYATAALEARARFITRSSE